MIRHSFSLFALGALVTSQVAPAYGATPAAPAASPDSSYVHTFPTQDNVRYIGSVTCQSSMCHGGASPSRNQFTIWSHDDFHSRAYATLITARSTRIAEALGINAATESNRCTVCHAPLADIPASHLASTGNASEGVSCESCHNGAAAWLRGHTRYDWSYADRVHAGLRDLRSAYVRAETCVSCHQVIDPELIKAGHPELTFEMDGQTASEPRHWKEKDDWFGPKAWLVGQAVALREISLQVARPGKIDPNLGPEQQAIYWLLQSVDVFKTEPKPAQPEQAAVISAWFNQVAQAYSSMNWNLTISTNMLTALAGTSSSFTDSSVPLAERELRAERLVLGLDRLFKAVHPEPTAAGQPELSALFDAVQDRGQFNPQTFSQALQKFADVVTPKK